MGVSRRSEGNLSIEDSVRLVVRSRQKHPMRSDELAHKIKDSGSNQTHYPPDLKL